MLQLRNAGIPPYSFIGPTKWPREDLSHGPDKKGGRNGAGRDSRAATRPPATYQVGYISEITGYGSYGGLNYFVLKLYSLKPSYILLKRLHVLFLDEISRGCTTLVQNLMAGIAVVVNTQTLYIYYGP